MNISGQQKNLKETANFFEFKFTELNSSRENEKETEAFLKNETATFQIWKTPRRNHQTLEQQ